MEVAVEGKELKTTVGCGAVGWALVITTISLWPPWDDSPGKTW